MCIVLLNEKLIYKALDSRFVIFLTLLYNEEYIEDILLLTLTKYVRLTGHYLLM